MGAAKWKVSIGDVVLGHFSAKTAEEAVEKAYKNNLPYKDYEPGTMYTVKRGNMLEEVCR